MTVLAAAWCEGGVFLAADSKRVDVVVGERVTLPEVEKLQQITPWCVMATAGAGTLGDAVRTFLRSVLFYDPPGFEEILLQAVEALRFMYGQYMRRYLEKAQPLVACLAAVQPGGEPRITILSSDSGFEPNDLPKDTPFWTVASDARLAHQTLWRLWTPSVALDRQAATQWMVSGVAELQTVLPSIGFPVRMAFVDRNSNHQWAIVPPR